MYSGAMTEAICQPVATKLPRVHKSINPRPSPLTQALDVRDALYRRLQNQELDSSDYAKLARAHKEACELVRELQGHGKPRPVTARNDPDAKRSRSRSTHAEPIPIPKE